MINKTLMIALMTFTALTLSHGAQAQQLGSDVSATIGGDFKQDNFGNGARLDTLIGSAAGNSSMSNVEARANVKGDVNIRNTGRSAMVQTKVGSVVASGGSSSKGSSSDFLDPLHMIPALPDVISSAGGGTYKASATVGGDVSVENTGDNAMISTDIGSITGAKRSASASADIKGSVIHRNAGDHATSNVVIGSVR